MFLARGFHTCLPHRDEGRWGRVYYHPDAISALCLRHVATSDIVFGIAEEGRGIHIEIGYASGLGGKRILLLYHEECEPSTLIWGLPGTQSRWEPPHPLADVVIRSYTDEQDLLQKIGDTLGEWFPGAAGVAGQGFGRTRVGVIDLGSHTVKLKVLDFHPGAQPIPAHEEKRSLGIIDDVLQTGRFSDETIAAVVGLVSEWKSKCDGLGARAIRVTGTAALRKAENSSALTGALTAATDLSLEVLSPETELDLVYAGVQSTMTGDQRLAVLNLGGGSTQLGIGSRGEPPARFLFDFGTRALTEHWPWKDRFHQKDFDEMLSFASGRMEQSCRDGVPKVRTIVHTGGELDFLLKCRVPMSVCDLSPTHVSELSLSEFTAFAARFAAMQASEVADQFGLDPAWASGSVASNAILLAAARLVGAERIVPSNFNVADGLALTTG